MNLQKKFRNFYTLYYLLTMDKNFRTKDPKKIKADQNKKIHEIMKIAYGIPFYRQKFEQSHTTPDDYHCSEDLVKFPTMDKAELRLWMQNEYENHPKERQGWEVLSTSGSSGVPLKVLLTQKEMACSNANWIRELAAAGYKPFTGKMYSFQTSHRDPNAKKHDSIVQKFGILQRKVVSEDNCVGDGIAEVIQDINAYKPDMLCFRRNCLVRIALYAKQHNLPLWKPKFYVPVSEMVDDVTRNLLTEMLGPGLIDGYGCTETSNCIVKYPGDDFFHVMNDIAVANVYDENNRLADNGKMILTTLYKKTFPIINYDVGDLAESYVKNGIRYYKNIQGRMNDLIKHENGVESSALELMKIANHTVGLAQFRFIQESYHDMYIQLAPDPNNTSRTHEEIEEYFIKSVQKLYGDEFKIRVEWMDILPPDETGKQRCFACKVK